MSNDISDSIDRELEVTSDPERKVVSHKKMGRPLGSKNKPKTSSSRPVDMEVSQ